MSDPTQEFENALLAVLSDLVTHQITFKQALEEIQQIFKFAGWTPPEKKT